MNLQDETILQITLHIFSLIFEKCNTITDIVKKYVKMIDSDKLLDIVEVSMLQNYIIHNKNLKENDISRDELIDLIKTHIKEAGIKVKNSSNIDTFVTFTSQKKGSNSQYKSEHIKKNPTANFKVMFDKMRKIEKQLAPMGRVTIFIEQAKLMADFSDSYKGYSIYTGYYGNYYHGYTYNYSDMSDSQLRTYFTWRTDFRNENYTKTSIYFVFLYACELINNIGVKNSLDAISKLLILLKKFAFDYMPDVQNTIIDWIKCYYVCNEIDIPFQDLIKTHHLEGEFCPIFDERIKYYTLDDLAKLSSYNVYKSKFLQSYPIYRDYLVKIFNAISINLSPLLKLYGIKDFFSFICAKQYKSQRLFPYINATYEQRPLEDKIVYISADERYTIVDNKIIQTFPIYSEQILSNIIGYFIKRIEANLRRLSKYKSNLRPNISNLLDEISSSQYYYDNELCLVEFLLSDESFDLIIDQTTTNQYKALTLNSENSEIPEICGILNKKISFEPYISIIKMRETFYLTDNDFNGYTFIQQANQLTNVSGNFCTDSVAFENSVPFLVEMTNEQLLCYLTYRTKVRQGIVESTYVSYAKLYVYELINKINLSTCDEAMKLLIDFLKKSDIYGKAFENFVVKCVKDFYICENFTDSFYDVVVANKAEKYFPNVVLDKIKNPSNFVLYNLSNYNIEKSKFYSEKTSPIIEDCFDEIYKNIDKFCKDNNCKLKDVLISSSRKSPNWEPFDNVPYTNYEQDSKKKVEISSNERYFYNGELWKCTKTPDKDNTASILIGYIAKRMEMKMREIIKFKTKLTINISVLEKCFKYYSYQNILSNPDLEKIIDDTTQNYFAKKYPSISVNPNAIYEKPVEVVIDKSKLSNIRKNADIIRDKLIIEEDYPEEKPVEIIPTEIVTETAEYSSSNPMHNLVLSLNNVQLQALKIIAFDNLTNKSLVKLATANKIMLEILLDSINEIAIDTIGDNIIETVEEKPYIYDEYFDEIKEFLEEK